MSHVSIKSSRQVESLKIHQESFKLFLLMHVFLFILFGHTSALQVRVTAAVDSGDEENTIYADDILETVTLSGNSQSGDGDKRCMIVKNQLGETLKLPLSTPGKFSSQLDTKWYSMAEILEKWELPVRVQQVDSNTSRSKSSLHNKFCLEVREVETNVLATVNRELIYLPHQADIEVCPAMSPTPTPQPHVTPSITVVSDDNVASSDDVSKDPVSSSPVADEAPASRSDSRNNSVFGDNLAVTLTAEDREKVRVGSIRRFGSANKLPQEDEDLEEDTRPHRALELFEQLQDKTAECIRLQEWCNKWQAKCQRLDSQTHNMQKSADDMERRAAFWRRQACQKVTIDDNVLHELEEYRKSGDKKLLGRPSQSEDDGSWHKASFTKLPPPAVKQKPNQKPKDISPASLTIDNMQTILKALHMEQYCQPFLDEQVDGGLLLDLPEDSLKSDLGMTSLLHRKKLLRTVHGQGPIPLHDMLTS